MDLLYKKFIKDYKNTNNPTVVKKYGLLAGIVGIILNILLFISKIVLAIISSSVSIISDAFNNLSDASSSIITLIGFKMSSKPADKEHPYGHERAEYISAFIISFIIIFIGVELAINSFNKIINPASVEFSYIILIILLITIIVKIWMGAFYYKTGKKINSLTLKASAKDSFNDVITTFIIAIGLLIGKLFNLNIDGYLGIAISVYILIGGISLIKETINKLIGGTPDIELIEKIKKEVLNEKEILGVHDILFHCYGISKIYMSLHAEIRSSMTLIEAHELIDNLEYNVKTKYGIELVIHMDPILLDDDLYKEINEKLNHIINEIDDKLTFHDLKIINKKSKSIIVFDLLIPYNFDLTNEEIYNFINKKIKEINKDYKVSITFDKN